MVRVKSLTVLLALALSMTAIATGVCAQDQVAKPADKPADAAAAAPPKEESSVTDHSIKIGGQTIPYKATAQTILLKDDKGEPTALLYSTAYTRSDVKDPSQRSVAFLYNGGPGSSSVWLHMGSVGPRRVVTVNAGITPPAPYKVTDNPECLLDKTDLVFVDPIGTGFSHAVSKAQDKDFWGVDQDVKSLAQFITIYVTRKNRRNSPKFLIGESYGTFRSAAELLAGSRQSLSQRHRAYLFRARSRDHLLQSRPGFHLYFLHAQLRGNRLVPQDAEGPAGKLERLSR